jgi:hypothetical protein
VEISVATVVDATAVGVITFSEALTVTGAVTAV